jgi:cadmium resistance protein CadD (predicted permease)
MGLKDIHHRIGATRYKPWQVYLLTGSLFMILGLYLDIGIVTSLLRATEEAVSQLEWLVILGIQGILIGFAAELLYEEGDGYAKSASHLFGSKDRTLFFRIGVMTAISGFITKIVPPVLRNSTEFLVIQTTGAVIALGILLIHEELSGWNLRTELPALVAGGVLAVAPSVL